jgi:signal transduction histidine kinase
MPIRVEGFLNRLTLAQRFMLASLIILVAGMIGIGWWVGQQIKAGVVHRTAATTALYVDSFISPHLQELGQAPAISPQHVEALNKLLRDTPMGQQIVSFKVWDKAGRVLYSTDDPASIGQVFPMEERLAMAWEGKVTSQISSLEDEENASQRAFGRQLLEIYSPVRLSGTNQIIAVAEFYQKVDDLQREIGAAQGWSWLVVGTAMLVIYLLLAGFVQRASDTIAHQQVELNQQVVRLTELLAQNEELHGRVRRAAASVATLNERFLKRIGAELHDGPTQDLSLALLRLDTVMGYSEKCCLGHANGSRCADQLDIIQSSLQHALQEIRAIAAGLGLPQLTELSLTETAIRAVRSHERRTSTKVKLCLDNLPEQTSLPVKITLFRLVQEALNNAYRHAGGTGQQVCLKGEASQLRVEVSDQGPGFDPGQTLAWGEHLGLIGMRERVESLGGLFRIESEAGRGTRVIARLSLQAGRDNHER